MEFGCKSKQTKSEWKNVKGSASEVQGEVEPKRCPVNMENTCQNLTNHRMSQNRDIGL